MFCKMIEELSLGYIEDDLSKSESMKFIKHLKECKNCRIKFNLINSNYAPEKDIYKFARGTDSFIMAGKTALSEEVMKKIDKSMYTLNRRKFHKKRIIVAVVCFLLLLTTTINAKSIYKTYQELEEIMFISKERLMVRLFKNADVNKLLEDEEYVEQVYRKFSQEIEKQVEKLKIGASKMFEFDEENGVFKVTAAKGESGIFISYGFKDHKVFYNDYISKLLQINSGNIINKNKEYFSTVTDLAKSGEIAVYPNYLPENYKLVECFRSLNPNNFQGSIGIRYETDEGNWLNFMFITDRIVEGPEGPGELLEIGGRQAFYSEQIISGKNSRQMSIYLGNGVLFPTLAVFTNSLDKYELLKIAENIELANEDANNIDSNSNYFVNIKDSRILKFTDEYISNIKRGSSEFTFKIDDNTEFYKRYQNNTYYIHYRNVKYNEIKDYLYLPLKIDKRILNEYNLVSAQVLGKPYTVGKHEAYQFRKGNSCLSINIEIVGTTTSYTNKTDALINNIFTSSHVNEYQPFYGESGQLYYFLAQDNYNEIRTVYEIDGYLYRAIYIPSVDLVKDHDMIQKFVHSIDSDTEI